VRPLLVGALGGLLVVGGLVWFLVAAGAPDVVTYGGSYEPLDTGSAYDSALALGFDDGLVVAWSTGQALGAALVVQGLLVLAAFGGWLLGRRRG